MPALIRITPENVQTFKAVRLRALEDTPLAFGSTHARESLLTEADWRERAKRWITPGHLGLMAIEDGEPCGIVCCILEAGERRAEVVSMWVAPTHRRSGLGSTLIEALRSWATEQGAAEMQLMVTSANQSAIDFYRRLGFTMTGHTEPYPNSPDLVEYEMILPLTENAGGEAAPAS